MDKNVSIIINREGEGFILLLLLYITHFVECEILCPGMISLLIVYEDYSRKVKHKNEELNAQAYFTQTET